MNRIQRSISGSFVFLFFIASGVFGQMHQPQATPAPTNSVPPVLNSGDRVEREVSGGSTDLYNIQLKAGQFMKIELEQTGCDVILALNSPAGVNVFEYKDDNFQNGPEVQTAAVAADGVYQLRIISFEPAEQKGRYVLRMTELREATEKELRLTAGVTIFNRLGKVKTGSLTTEQLRQVVADYKTAIEHFRFAESPRHEALGLSSLGSIEVRLGNWRGAISIQQRSLELYRGLGADLDIAVLLSNMATTYYRNNEPQKALDCLYEASAVSEKRGDDFNHSRALNLIGFVYESLGDSERARTHFAQALEKATKINHESFIVDSNISLGRISYQSHDLAQAAVHLETAVGISRKIGNKRLEINSLTNLSQILFDAGDRSRSLECVNKAIEISRGLGDKLAEASVLRRLGKIQLALGDADKAAASFDAALVIFRALEDSGNVGEMLLLSARTDLAKGRLDSALEKTSSAIASVEQIRARVQSTELRDAFSANLRDFYALQIELLMMKHAQDPQKGFAARAFEASERARARGLLNLLSESNADIGREVDPKLFAQWSEQNNLLASRVENLTRVLAGKNEPAQVDALKAEIERIRADVDQTRTQIRAASPRYATLTEPTPLTLAETQRAVLDDDSVLLEYSLGQTRSYLFIVTKNRLETIELPRRDRIEDSARMVYAALTARNRRVKFETVEEFRARINAADADFKTLAADLSRMVIGPAASAIRGKRVMVVADGALQYIPFAALSVDDRFLAEQNEVVNLPSASVLAVLRRETGNRAPARKTLAVFADPIFEKRDERILGTAAQRRKTEFRPIGLAPVLRGDQELLRLPFTRREAQFVSGLVPSPMRSVKLDADANRINVLSPEMSEYRYLHFATHGFINSQIPELSGIVLSLFDRDGNEQNGFLSLADTYNMNLNAELVVLSGCRTGLGREIVGEGLVGLTRGFLFAGSRRVTVSLWDVNDEATAELMKRFYREMLAGRKLSPAAAIREAQVSLMRDQKWSAPYYWASFVMQGEPR